MTALKAAAESTRLRLLSLCSSSDLTVSELTQILGQSQPRVSRHLKLLHQAGLLDRQREGSWVYFGLASEGPAADLARTLVESMPLNDPILALDLERLQQVFEVRKKKTEAYFQKNAQHWNQIRSLYVDEAEVERALVELIQDETVESLLDIGTGTGRILELFSKRVTKLIGIDSSCDMLQIARATLARKRIKNCLLRRCDMYHLPFPRESFQAVTIHQVLHFAGKPLEVLREAARVLNPGGLIFLADFEEHPLEELRAEHAHRWLGFHSETLQAWLREVGLEPEEHVSLTGGTLSVGVWTARQSVTNRDSK